MREEGKSIRAVAQSVVQPFGTEKHKVTGWETKGNGTETLWELSRKT